MANISKATFLNPAAIRETYATRLWAYDYGQLLNISGLDLPPTFEAHFCNARDVQTVTRIGSDCTVAIPDELLTNGRDIEAYIYLHTGESDGETVYKITIPVKRRPRPGDGNPTPAQQSAISQAIAALNAGVTAAETAQEKAEEAQGKAEDAEQAIESMNATAFTLPEGFSATVEKTVDPDTGAVTLKFGIPTGDTGKSAYESAQDGGYTGTERQFNRDLADVSDKYEKPSTGIPKTDLAAGVQSSLDKADTALQAVPNTYRTAAEQDAIDDAQDAAIADKEPRGLGITAAQVGQLVTVEAVDADGKPTRWTASDPVTSVNGQTGVVALTTIRIITLNTDRLGTAGLA